MPVRADDARRLAGAFYTPLDIAERLIELVLGDRNLAPMRVLDPSCGSGNFLGLLADRVVTGIDTDPLAVAECRRRLADAGAQHPRIECADAFSLNVGHDFDLVIGNPPFLSQLSSHTARTPEEIVRLRERFGVAVGALTDPAALFLLLSLEAARADGGVVCLIQPLSTLASRDTVEVRRRVLEQSSMVAAWVCEESVFEDADVRVWAPILVKGASPGPIQIYRGRHFEPIGTVDPSELDASSWSALLAAAKGLPRRTLQTSGVVGDIAAATADFRDQYYGLRECVIDSPEGDDSSVPPLVTAGLLDPARVAWGLVSTKFDKVSYRWPRVDVASLTPKLQGWAALRLVPKVLLATQTRVLEAVVDGDGRYLPSVPVISIVPASVDELWRIGAVLSSPPVTLVAARRHLGTALSSDALKLRAAEVVELPLPADRVAWDAGADAFRAASDARDDSTRLAALAECGRVMCGAYGLGDDSELLDWWVARLPRTRRSD